jgi:hypothetical protein
MTVGKNTGKTFGTIHEHETGYCGWVLGLTSLFGEKAVFQRFLSATTSKRTCLLLLGLAGRWCVRRQG